MANVKITALPSLTGAASHSLDVIPVVDVSADATSKMTRAEFFSNIPPITGNVGIGVTPSAWGSNYKAIESSANSQFAIAGANVNGVGIYSNAYAENAAIKYKTTGAAARYNVELARHTWEIAASGTAGNAITFTQAMTLDASGNFMVGTTSPSSSKFRVVGTDTSAIGLINGASYGIRFGSAAGIGANIDAVDVGGVTSYQPLIVGGSTLGLQTGGTQRVLIDASGNVGIGTASPNAASIVDAQSTTKGVRFPNMTTTQKTAMANVAGNVVFDTTLGKLCVNSGSGWQTITSI